MQQRRPCIEIARSPADDEGDEQIGEQADGRDHHYAKACNGLGIEQPRYGFNRDYDYDQKHGQAVDEGGDDLGSRETIRMSAAGGAAGNPRGECRKTQCQRIRQHVAGIAHQGERMKRCARNEFNHRVAERDHQCDD